MTLLKLYGVDLLEGVDVVGGVVERVVGLEQHVEVADVERDVEQRHQEEIVEPFQLQEFHNVSSGVELRLLKRTTVLRTKRNNSG